jgi:hypothetical protein
MYIGDKGLAQVSRVAPLEFKASLFPKNVTRFSPVGDPNFGHSLLKCRVTDKNLGEVLSAQGKEMREIRSNIAALSTQMAAIMEEVKRNRIDRYRAQSLRITPKGGSKYGLIIMLEPPHLINSLLYVFRSDIGGITPGLFVCCPLA